MSEEELKQLVNTYAILEREASKLAEHRFMALSDAEVNLIVESWKLADQIKAARPDQALIHVMHSFGWELGEGGYIRTADKAARKTKRKAAKRKAANGKEKTT